MQTWKLKKRGKYQPLSHLESLNSVLLAMMILLKIPLRVVFNQHQGDIKVQIAQAENELGNYMIKPAFMLNDDGTSDITKPVKSLCIQSSMYVNRCKSLLLWVIFVPLGHKREGQKEGKSNAKNCTTVNLALILTYFLRTTLRMIIRYLDSMKRKLLFLYMLSWPQRITYKYLQQ